MSRRKGLALALLFILATPGNAFADAAPPANPPGSSILPPGQTMVQMVAESVTITVEQSASRNSPVQVTALFGMYNNGEATETMNVRFPLENPNGMGDGYGGRPVIAGFAAKDGAASLPVSVTEEALDGGIPIKWAIFPVTFPPKVDRLITVTYSMLLSASADGSEEAQVEYVFETGAGWYGPIDSAVLTLRLPYAASLSNVYLSDPWNPEKVAPPVFVGREVRWDWQDFEPTSSDNLVVVFVWPAKWNRILSLEAQTGEDPSNAKLAVELAEAYRDAGSERHGFPISDPLYRLSLQAVNMALPFNPSSSSLRWERFIIEAWKCTGFPRCDSDTVARLLREHEQLPEYPGGAPPQDLESILYWLNDAAGTSTSPEPNASGPPVSPKSTRTPRDPGVVIAPTEMGGALPEVAASARPSTPVPSALLRTSRVSTIMFALLVFFVAAIALLALARRRRPG